MRSRDPRVALHDAMMTAEWLERRCAGISFDQFVSDDILQAAVERKLEVVGEALARAKRMSPALAEEVPDLHRIIGLRNVLAHGYDVIDCQEIHLIVTVEVPGLAAALRRLPGMEDAR